MKKGGGTMDFTHREMMIVAAAREIKDGETLLTGAYWPILPSVLAKKTHAPNAIFVFEGGVVCNWAPPRIPLIAHDPTNLSCAVMCGDLLDTLGMVVHGGWADVGFLSASAVDKYGNVNTTCMGDYLNPRVRLPGSGGASDIASSAKRVIIILEQSRERFPERVDFITTPGFLQGSDSRERAGLRPSGPNVVVTDLGVYRFEEDSKEMYLDSYHPGVSVDKIKDNVGWELKISPQVKETKPPSAWELKVLREEVDPMGMYLRDVRTQGFI
jgi:glutaconate CoA-transferase subunit B